MSSGDAKDWRYYEKEIAALYRREYPDAKITFDAKVEGRYSKVQRQIDILIEGKIAGYSFVIMIDGKFYNRKVDVKDVEAFIGMTMDVGAHKGIVITQIGYTAAAIDRVFNDPLDIEVDILNFAELQKYQGDHAIPFSIPNGVSLLAPLGFVIDARRTIYADSAFEGGNARPLAHIYQRGLELAQAIEKSEWMYVQFWKKNAAVGNLEAYRKFSEAQLRHAYDDVSIEYQGGARQDRPSLVRIVRSKKLPSTEYSGLVEFKSYILLVVMFSPDNLAKKNLRKLDSVLRSAVPLSVMTGSEKDTVEIGPEE